MTADFLSPKSETSVSRCINIPIILDTVNTDLHPKWYFWHLVTGDLDLLAPNLTMMHHWYPFALHSPMYTTDLVQKQYHNCWGWGYTRTINCM